MAITFVDEKADRQEVFLFPDGIRSFVSHLNENKDPLYDEIVYFEKEHGDAKESVTVEIAMQHNASYS